MNPFRLVLAVAAVAALAGCETLLDPTLTKEERAVLDFKVEGITMGGPPGQLAKFSQVEHIPVKIGGYDIYEIYNATPTISQIKAWYYDNKLARLELRYFDGRGTNTLTRAGGWQGIRDYMMEKFGPPSRFGSDVPVVATTKTAWNTKYAKFNGEWLFTRIKRQLNYIAMADAAGGIGVVTIQDTTPIVVPPMAGEPAPKPKAAPAKPAANPVPQEVAAPNPGF